MKYFKLLVVFTTICCLFSACDDLFQSYVASPYQAQAIAFTNNGTLKGTYIITGSHSYVEKTTDLLPPLPAGEYNVFFINEKVNGNICYFDGKNPTLIGNTEFIVSPSDKARSISVSLKEITCHLSFKVGEGVKFSKAVINAPNSMYIDGELGASKNLTFYNDCYVIAGPGPMKIFVSVDVDDTSQPIKVLEGVIDAQAGHKYTLKLEKDKDSFSVSE
jgi:hypothetical protein